MHRRGARMPKIGHRKTAELIEILNMGVSKNRGKTPKMDGL